MDDPSDLEPGELRVFLLNLHGGGSHGTWQHEYFPAHDYCDKYRLVVAMPSAGTAEPSAHWAGEADDEHLQNICKLVFDEYGKVNIRAFWLAGHSQGGLPSRRLLGTEYFAKRVDGWLSLCGGRLGLTPKRGVNPGRPAQPRQRPRGMQAPEDPDVDISFIYSIGEHEIAELRDKQPRAEKYDAGSRVQMPDVVDTEPGRIYDTQSDGRSNPGWGMRPKPGTAQIFVYPDARDGRVIADVVRLDMGHTEGFEPKIAEEIIKLLVQEPGGRLAKLG